MRRPVNAPYTITTEFGVPDSYAKFGRHSGVDYAVPAGRPVYAPIAGTVQTIVSNTGGNMVVVFDGQFYHRLMHNQSFSVPNGAQVQEGQEVAKCGTTGLSTGPHVHWDVATQIYPTSFDQFRSPAKWLAGEYQAPPPAPSPRKDIMSEEDCIKLCRAMLGRFDEVFPEASRRWAKENTGKTFAEVHGSLANHPECIAITNLVKSVKELANVGK